MTQNSMHPGYSSGINSRRSGKTYPYVVVLYTLAFALQSSYEQLRKYW